MANDDVELSIGVKFDEQEITDSYNKILKDLSKETKAYLANALDEMKGAAASSWGPLPFYSMHDTSSGNKVASQAFLAGLARDLPSLGAAAGSSAYESALMNATYKSSISDPMQRYHRLIAEGRLQAADATHPDTALGRAIENDYALMSQPWSRDFIHTALRRDNLEGLSLSELRDKAKEMDISGMSKANKEDLINAIIGKSEAAGTYIDFEGMRKYAVEAGLGRWINPEQEKTADNFELINDELEDIEENSGKSDKVFRNWNDTLKGVLGTLTAIGSLSFIGKTFETAYKASEKGTTEAATTLDRRRAFIGMGALDVLATQVAGKSIGLGKDDIYNEILTMSSNREKYRLLGEGLNALYPSLTGIFDNIMSSDNPYDVYKSILTEVYGQMQGADDTTRAQTLMLLESQGLGSVAQIIGAFLSNPKLAAQLNNNPLELFNLKGNPYYTAYQSAEAVLPDLTKLNESIKASYSEMYLAWETSFGLPFKGWWDSTLQNTVVPWFLKIISLVNPQSVASAKETSDFDKAWDKALKKQQKANSVSNREKISGYWGLASNEAVNLNSVVSYTSYTPDRALYTPAGWNAVKNLTSAKPKEFLKSLESMATEGVYAPGTLHEAQQTRALLAVQWLQSTGLYNDLNDLRTTDIDKYTMKVLKEYLAEGDENILGTYLEEAYTHSEGWKVILEFIRDYKAYLLKNPDELKVKIDGIFGTGEAYGTGKLYQEASKELNRAN